MWARAGRPAQTASVAGRSTRKGSWIAVAIGLFAVAWLWSMTQLERPERTGQERDRALEAADHGGVAPIDRPRSAAPSQPARRAAPAPATPLATACAPHADRACRQGDVYWLDACGRRQDKAEECGARLCRDDACEPLDAQACAGLPLEGRCEGDVVRGCIAGWPFERDCGALGKRCVMGDEGAVCRKPSEDDCDRFGALPRCAGQKLLTCSEGKRVVRDCAALGASCEVLPQTGLFACVARRQLERAPRDHDPCGPCGCPDGAPAFSDEACNGKDDDGDNLIDEQVSCEPVQVTAYVITDAAGRSSYSREDIEHEIATVDALFSADNGGLPMHVALADVVELALPELLDFDDGDIRPLLEALHASAGAAEGLRVPIVFTDELANEDVPKAGLSTLPNGYCGGVRRTLSPQPLRGFVVVGKRRAPTTVAHELGHFLGLCHTHEEDPPAVVSTVQWRAADGRSVESTCDAACTLEGDGICDTPIDPGPQSCSYDTRCDAHCAAGQAPSTHNLMSYYTSCRDRFTPLQTVELQRSRALLEGFYRCAEPSACPCTQLGPGCPEQMSCRPIAGGGAGCTLDGAFAQGERCAAHGECGAGLLCIDQRCAPWPAAP